MKKILLLLVTVGVAGNVSAAQQGQSGKGPTMSYAYAVGAVAAAQVKPINMTPFSQTPTFQSLERAQQQLDVQHQQSQWERVSLIESLKR